MRGHLTQTEELHHEGAVVMACGAFLEEHIDVAAEAVFGLFHALVELSKGMQTVSNLQYDR